MKRKLLIFWHASVSFICLLLIIILRKVNICAVLISQGKSSCLRHLPKRFQLRIQECLGIKKQGKFQEISTSFTLWRLQLLSWTIEHQRTRTPFKNHQI